MDIEILRRLAELERLPMGELRRRWETLFGTKAPGHNRTFLVKRLSYRIQELAYGGVRPETRQQLDRLLEEAGYDELGRPKNNDGTKLSGDDIAPGTVLIREYQGVRHTVTVLPEGFEYRGKPYRSLTAIAREIAGCQWNGPSFFGLRGKDPATVKRRRKNGR